MSGTLILLHANSWGPWGIEVLTAARSGRTGVISLDPITTSVLDSHSVPFRSIETCEPRRQWEETNAVLFDLLTGLSGNEQPALADTFSHYLISEANLLFDRLCRIKAAVEREQPAVLAIGASPANELANDLHAAAAGLPWPAEMRLRRWDLESPLARLDDR